MALFNFYPLLRSPRPINSTRFGDYQSGTGPEFMALYTRPAITGCGNPILYQLVKSNFYAAHDLLNAILQAVIASPTPAFKLDFRLQLNNMFL